MMTSSTARRARSARGNAGSIASAQVRSPSTRSAMAGRRGTRFQPGQSGNPNGRPKGAKSLATMIERELNQVVEVREGGRKLKLTKREVMVRQTVNKAIQGDLKAIEWVVRNYPKLTGGLPEAGPAMGAADGVRQKEEQAELTAFLLH